MDVNELRDRFDQIVQRHTFPMDGETHEAIHQLSVAVFQAMGMDAVRHAHGDLNAMFQAAMDPPLGLGCGMFQLGYSLGLAAGAEVLAVGIEQLDSNMEPGAMPCTCRKDRNKWWTGVHRPPSGLQPACPRWHPPEPKW